MCEVFLKLPWTDSAFWANGQKSVFERQEIFFFYFYLDDVNHLNNELLIKFFFEFTTKNFILFNEKIIIQHIYNKSNSRQN